MELFESAISMKNTRRCFGSLAAGTRRDTAELLIQRYRKEKGEGWTEIKSVIGFVSILLLL